MIILHEHILTVLGYHLDDKDQVTHLFITPIWKSQSAKPSRWPDTWLEKNTSFKLSLTPLSVSLMIWMFDKCSQTDYPRK